MLVTDAEEDRTDGRGRARSTIARSRDQLAGVSSTSKRLAHPASALLFETGPGNHWLVRPWARACRRIRAADRSRSRSTSGCRTTPTFRFSTRYEIPGLNFAIVGDSYAYHTARDTPERLSPQSLRTTGENVVSIVDGAAISQTSPQRTSYAPTYFDIGGTVAVALQRCVRLAS